MPQDTRPSALAEFRRTRRRTDTPAPLSVWKFGGTSVADRSRLEAVASRMVEAHRAGHRVVAVLSAMGGTTDELTELARGIADAPPLREMDALLAVGESVSCALTAMAVQQHGVRAVSLDAAQVGIVTDDHHANARLRHVRPERILAELDDDAIVLVTGFQGVTESGDVTTLGRGGSDASAVAVAAALGADHCTIFSDVDGVHTADPRLVPDARPLASLRHEEMLELAEGGAAVLQPRAVELAAAHDVAVHLRSSFTTDRGTWVRRDPPALESTDVAGVAHRRHESLHRVAGPSVRELTSALAERGVTPGTVIVGDDVRFTAPGAEDADVRAAVEAAGGTFGGSEELGSVSVVASGITRRPDLPARALAALEEIDVDVRMTTTTSGRVCLHVGTARVEEAVQRLHDVFVGAADSARDAIEEAR